MTVFMVAGKQLENITIVPVWLERLFMPCVAESSFRALEKSISLILVNSQINEGSYLTVVLPIITSDIA
jgi:hypothetical protein